MDDETTAALRKRRQTIHLLAICAAIVALGALFVRGLLVQPSIAIAGVAVSPHVPGHRLAGWDLSLVSDGAGWIHHVSTTGLYLLSSAALFGFIYALVQRQRPLAIASAFFLVFGSTFAPAPTLMQPSPPKAMSVEVAERFVADPENFHERDTVSRRYMQAQIAYIRGDRALARSLSAGLDARALASPIEGAYRLRFLQGTAIEETNLCTRSMRCISPERLAMWQRASWFVAFVSALLALTAWWFARSLSTRLERMATLEGQLRLRRMAR